MVQEGPSGETAEVGAGSEPPAAASLSVLLVVRSGAGVETRELGAAGELVIGRRLPSDVIVEDQAVSRMHLRVALRQGRLWVEDLGSRNGSYVGEQRLEPHRAQPLDPGQPVRLGDAQAVILLAPAASTSQLVGSAEDLMLFLRWECARAEATGSSVAVLSLRTLKRGQPIEYEDKIRPLLRPFDQVAATGVGRVLVVTPGSDAAGAEAFAREVLAAHGTSHGAPLGIGVALAHRADEGDRAVACARAAAQRAHERQPVVVAQTESASRKRGAASGTGDGGGAPSGNDDEPVQSSAASQQLFASARRAAKAPVSVLILGETGTGKEVVARYVHRHSPRARGPLVTVNCGAIAPGLLASTLFGHVRGAFTGASESRSGLFEDAHGGTLFLDEVGELSLDAQVSLLRVLETGRVARVGASRERSVDVRVIAATHRDLEAAVQEGRFREDLYYRLNAVALQVPPLRERPVDLPPLCAHLLSRMAERWEEPLPSLSDAALARLRDYHFPGNVRELRNVLEHAVVNCEGPSILPHHLPDRVLGAAGGGAEGPSAADHHELPFRQRIERYEVELIREALSVCAGNQTRAAEALRIPRRTLVHKLRAYGLQAVLLIASVACGVVDVSAQHTIADRSRAPACAEADRPCGEAEAAREHAAAAAPIPPPESAPQESAADSDADPLSTVPGHLRRAKQLFLEGLAHAEEARWREAAEAFAHSNELAERPNTLFNLALAQLELGEHLAAHESLTRFVELADPSDRAQDLAQARDLLASLRAKLGNVHLSVKPPDAKLHVDGAVQAAGGSERRLLLRPGSHRLRLSAKGYEPQAMHLELSAGQALERSVVLAESAPAEPPPGPQAVRAVAPEAGDHRPFTNPRPASDDESLWHSPWLWGAVGVAVAGAVVGSIFLLRAEPSPEAPYRGTTGIEL